MIMSEGPESEAEKCLQALANRHQKRLAEELAQKGRRTLDEIVFDLLHLTKGEREAVYEAVINLVQARLGKAESI